MGKNKKNRNVNRPVSDQPLARPEAAVDLSQVRETEELATAVFQPKGGTVIFEDDATDADKRRIFTARAKARVAERMASVLGRREFVDNIGYFRDPAVARENPWLINWVHDVVFGKDVYKIYEFFDDSAAEVDKYLEAVLSTSQLGKF
jgi:hypothetical protein